MSYRQQQENQEEEEYLYELQKRIQEDIVEMQMTRKESDERSCEIAASKG